LLSSATKHAPSAFSTSVQRHSFTEKINLSLVLPHQIHHSWLTFTFLTAHSCHRQVIFTSEDVVQVNISAASGDMCILANHIPSIEHLCPSVLKVIESGNISKKWF
ncbi:hypothetical protein HD554DRAFT_1982350, partial [Boletus coccyginus]